MEMTKAFDFTPSCNPSLTVAYPAGIVRNVTRECAALAIAKGAGRLTKRPEPANDHCR